MTQRPTAGVSHGKDLKNQAHNYVRFDRRSDRQHPLGRITQFCDAHLPFGRAGERVDIREIVPLGGGPYEEHPTPKQLPGNRVTLLSPVGSLFFAGATEFEEDLPAIENAERPVVLLRLQGKLVLVGVSEPVYAQLQKTSLLDQLGPENIYKATAIMGDSPMNAYQDAQAWLESGDAES